LLEEKEKTLPSGFEPELVPYYKLCQEYYLSQLALRLKCSYLGVAF